MLQRKRGGDVKRVLTALLFTSCATVPPPAPVTAPALVVMDTAPVPLPPYRSVVEIVQFNDVGAQAWSWTDTVDLLWDGGDKTTWTKQADKKEIPWPKDRYLVREVGRVER
jgi:hypothetical protein